MPVIVKTIQWSPMPRVPHGVIGTIQARHGLRRVAGIIDENANPRKPKGSTPHIRPFTLELYVPLLGGQDRILKFTSRETAELEAARALLRFVGDAIEESA